MAILHKTIALNNGVSSNKQDAFQDGPQNLKFKLGSDISTLTTSENKESWNWLQIETLVQDRHSETYNQESIS